MRILGISCYYHDAAAAFIQDGELIAAAEEERFSRKKHDSEFPRLAIQFCLDQAGITSRDLDYVVFYEKPLLKFERILLTSLQTFPRSFNQFRRAMSRWLGSRLWLKSQIQDLLDVDSARILFSEHHLSHAASAFFSSPYSESAILTLDGVGEWASTTLGVGRASWDGKGKNEIRSFCEQRFPHSLGLMYSAFTAFLGFEVNEGEYKVMGMAPYGTPRYADKVWKVIQPAGRGSFRLNMDYFSFHYSSRRSFSSRFERLFGKPRNPDIPFVLTRGEGQVWQDALDGEGRHYADVAASVQLVTEEVILGLARELHARTGLDRLCIAGGIGYNSVANGRVLRETPFRHIFIQPAAGDSGGALGAALYAYHVLLQKPRRFVMEHAYWGKSFDGASIRDAVQRRGFQPKTFSDERALVQEAARRLTEGQVVGWYQGRAEWGPRALGNRSILADPRAARMKEVVNRKIKFREPFRPFAPSILDRGIRDVIEHPPDRPLDPARFMLMVSPIRPNMRARIPAVTHVDGTGRAQMVEKKANPLYYELIRAFEDRTGVPAVLNTSFNLKGEPIVNSPDDALSTFSRSDMDVVVMGEEMICKSTSGGLA